MAGRRSAYRLFAPAAEGPTSAALAVDEFNESDIWDCAEPRSAAAVADFVRKPIPAARSARKKTEKKVDPVAAAAASLPVNIPDWSKILKEEYKGNGCDGREWDLDGWDEGGEDAGVVIPPHEYLWRNRAASFSVHEGLGRTLKGRDLSRVRNAILAKTGLQD